MTSTNKKRGGNALQKRKGMAIKGLKAWIKALELDEGVRKSQGKYRYEIIDATERARIYLTADETTVEGTDRSLAEWAAIGKPARHALIGLRYTKDKLTQESDIVMYNMNIVTGEAHLLRNGVVADDHPTTIEAWAEIGREVEKREFESLQAATDWRNEAAIKSVTENMIRWTIFRAPRPDKSKSA